MLFAITGWMMNLKNIEFFDGAVRFNVLCMVINVVLFTFFALSWYFSRVKNKKIIDYWHFVVLMFFIIPVVLMYPFSASVYNIMAVRDKYSSIEPYVNCAYLISVLGYISILIGGRVRKMVFSVKDVGKSNRLVTFVENITLEALSEKLAIRAISVLTVVLLASFICFQISNDYLGDPRRFFMQQEKYRPIYNLLVSFFKFSVVFLGISIINKRNNKDIFLFIMMCFLGFFIGTRSAVLDAVVYVFVFWAMCEREKFKILYAVIFGLIVIALIVILGKIRGNGGVGVLSFMLYGNTFSDTRDFAWILSSWDYNYVLGKTYLSGFLSFIPAHFLEDRKSVV